MSKAVLKKENNSFGRKTKTQKIIFAIVFVIFLCYAISLLFPLWWLINSSLKSSVEFSMNKVAREPFALPDIWQFSNYIEVFSSLIVKDTNFLGMIFNSLWYICFASGMNILCSSLFAYVMAKYDFKGRNAIYTLFIVVMTMPIVGNGGAYYVFIRQLGIFDTPLYPLLVNVYCFTGNFLYMYAAFKSISWSYAEAVFIDGGNHYTVLFRIMLPQAMPILGTLFLTSAIGQWNEYTNILMYLPSYPTVASGLYSVRSILNRMGITFYFTGLVIATIPILILYMIFSNTLMKNLALGGIKG